MLFSRFESCVAILNNHELSAVNHTINALQAQRLELEIEKQSVSSDVRKTAVNANYLNVEQRRKIQRLTLDVIPKLQTSLRRQQGSGIYAESKKITISRLIRKKQEVERCERSIAENVLRVKQIAKILRSIVNELDRLDIEMNLMGDCLVINEFMLSLNIDVKGITQYEVERLHKKFLNQEVVSGHA